MSKPVLNHWIDFWGMRFAEAPFSAILNSCGQEDPLGEYALLLAWGQDGLEQADDSIEPFQTWAESRPDWIFGVLSYDLKNAFEALETRHKDPLELPSVSVFSAQMVVGFTRDCPDVPRCLWGDPEDFAELCTEAAQYQASGSSKGVPVLEPISTKEHYRNALATLIDGIRKGDLYEINYCRLQRGTFSQAEFDPLEAYRQLCLYNPAAQSVLYRSGSKGLISASPERFVQKRGTTLRSQPIKGTAARSLDPLHDLDALNRLINSPKERAENTMIVDLVRDDFAKIAVEGSISVPEWCAHRSLARVHQMYSTIECRLPDRCGWIEIVRACFPMGSMTGMPKYAAMEWAEQLEGFRRGWYSGSFFYRKPNGDVDSNVLIRSLLYNEEKGLCSMGAGGAITTLSHIEAEWEETEHKFRSVLSSWKAPVTQVTSAPNGDR